MLTKITDESEVFDKARVLQHAPSITAHRKNTASRNSMMLIQNKLVRAVGNGALVNHRLAVVLARAFQFIQFE